MLQDTMDIIENWIPRHKVHEIFYFRENTHHDKSLVVFMEWLFTTECLMFNFSSMKWKHPNCNFNLERLY